MSRRAPLLLPLILLALVASFSATAQQPHAALQSQEAFLAEISGKKWETSFTNYPEMRFFADKIEILAPDGKITSTLVKVSHPEPGIIRTDFRGGDFQFFIFADDLQTFVIANMATQGDLTISNSNNNAFTLSATGSGTLPWKDARLSVDKLEVLDSTGGGSVTTTHPAFAYYPHVHGLLLPGKTAPAGAIVMSRQKPGTGWYMSGRNLGTGVRTEKSGYFRTFLTTKLTGFPHRSAHFTYPLLIAGYPDFARAQERYAEGLVANTYGETSDKVAHCLNEMGTLRRIARSYSHAAVLQARALEHAQKNFAVDAALLLDFSTDLSTSQNDAGDFAAARKTLAEAHPLLSSAGDKVSPTYTFYESLGMAEFGLRNYAQAARHFSDNIKRAQDANLKGSVVVSLLYLIPCQLAQNQTAAAEASLRQAMEVQSQREKENPTYNYDTWKLAFACVALGKNQEALKYSPVYKKRQNWVAYEEYGRLVSLLHSGDRAAAQALAKDFIARFDNIQEIESPDDIDPIAVKLTMAIADPTPATIAALDQLWQAQVESLRNRPLKNYLFARVMVLTLAKLKTK